MQHVLVLAYFSAEEAARYKVLARVLASWPSPRATVSCLICTVGTGVEPDEELEQMFAKVMPTRSFRCGTPVTGYPARPTAMFWEIMEHIADQDPREPGFALWFEADMVPTRPSWLDELDASWRPHDRPLIMGRLQPRTYVRARNTLVAEHINGGACYARNYAHVVPDHLKDGTFDLRPWQLVCASGRYVPTDLFAYSTRGRLAEEMKGRAAVLHGYRQDKPAYYEKWAALATNDGSGIAEGPEGACCDLRARNLMITYCPIHSPRTPQVRAANLASLCLAVPYFALRRRFRRLDPLAKPCA